MKCPGCGETNHEGYRFCRSCGRALPTPEAPASRSVNPFSETAATVAADASSEPLPTYKLVATAGLLLGRNFTIGPGGLTIGRDPATCQVVVADDEVSRLHAWIGLNDKGDVVLRDRHSANGTYVNRVRVQEKVLRTTDEIAIGSGGRHLFRIEQVPTPAPSPRGAQGTPGKAGLHCQAVGRTRSGFKKL